ncbi:pyridoxal-phosphate dependent enzyme [[Actinomadura] parvosata]|uniref:pyridoxal-phosphate dependent enzyme n=1 Tax=[Actinomadura] parvosata TaxID=1955412 RepID=UPI00406D03D1
MNAEGTARTGAGGIAPTNGEGAARAELVTAADISAAGDRIAPYVRRTPLLRLPGERLWVKPENRQPTRSFKVRGAVNAVGRLAGRGVRHVIAQSSGNHAQAIAYAAAEQGVRATVVLPDTAPELKVRAARRLGAEVVIVPPACGRRRAWRWPTGSARRWSAPTRST